ncbi:MAG TPA: hypothetical protein DCQ06_03260 [Myxococcales bacterium]|nr:hypothetical protein [Myxococcales bacterium]
MIESSIAQRVAVATGRWQPDRFAEGFARLSLLATERSGPQGPWYARLVGEDRLELWQHNGPWVWFDKQGFGEGSHRLHPDPVDGHQDLRLPWMHEAEIIEQFERPPIMSVQTLRLDPSWYEPLADLSRLEENIRAALSIEARSGLAIECCGERHLGLRLERPSMRLLGWLEHIERPWAQAQAHAAFALAAVEVTAVLALGSQVTLTWQLADI